MSLWFLFGLFAATASASDGQVTVAAGTQLTNGGVSGALDLMVPAAAIEPVQLWLHVGALSFELDGESETVGLERWQYSTSGTIGLYTRTKGRVFVGAGLGIGAQSSRSGHNSWSVDQDGVWELVETEDILSNDFGGVGMIGLGAQLGPVVMRLDTHCDLFGQNGWGGAQLAVGAKFGTGNDREGGRARRS